MAWGQSEVLPEGDTLRQAFEQLAEGGRFIVGGPETCARQLREHVDRLGATAFLFRFQSPECRRSSCWPRCGVPPSRSSRSCEDA